MVNFKSYVGIMVGLTLLFYFTGLLENTASAILLNRLLSPEGFQTGSTYALVLVMLGFVEVSAIIVGFFSRASSKQVAVTAFTIAFIGLLWDFGFVLSKVISVNPVIGVLIFSPFLMIYVAAIVEWWSFVSG